MFQKVLLILIILLLIAGIAYWLWQKPRSNSSLGSQIFKEAERSSNPFAKVNPFKGVYKNPFE